MAKATTMDGNNNNDGWQQWAVTMDGNGKGNDNGSQR